MNRSGLRKFLDQIPNGSEPMSQNSPMERALRLAAITGLKATYGPALISAAQNRPERQALAMAAMGEMLIDKLPFMPSRSRLPLLIPRAFAGYWTAKQSLERDGQNDPNAAAMGAVVAAGVAITAPLVRKALRVVLGLPDAVIGAAEDYIALKIGSQAVGLSMDDLQKIGLEAFHNMVDKAGPLAEDIRHRLEPAHS
ncbi:MAG: hypothetical protein JWN86_2367 [Planctomycetota bacterium]|nr:hypothetical protein [Planctomycetota bacterium]